MAGIGFTLERMTTRRSLGDVGGAYAYAAFLVAGPWIVMVAAIAAVSAGACPAGQCGATETFRSVLIYNFLISLVLSGAISLPATRFVSDEIFAGRDRHIAGAFAAAAALYAALALALAAPFYVFATTLPDEMVFAALQNLLLVGATWVAAPFLGAMKDYRAISAGFAAGAAAIVAWSLAMRPETSLALLQTFNIGFAITTAILVGLLVRRFGASVRLGGPAFARAARYWDLAAIGGAGALAAWIDKLILWFFGPADLRLTVAGGLRTMPAYDSAMFWAQLTAIPLLIIFFVHVETEFFRRHQSFYRALARHATVRDLEERMAALAQFSTGSLFRLFAAASLVAIAAALAELVLFEPLGFTADQIGALRAGLIGAAFYTCASVALIFLLYFDLRKQALAVTLFYLCANALATAAFAPTGLPYLGYGQLIAAAATFVLAAGVLFREIPWLHYHAAVTNNSALGR